MMSKTEQVIDVVNRHYGTSFHMYEIVLVAGRNIGVIVGVIGTCFKVRISCCKRSSIYHAQDIKPMPPVAEIAALIECNATGIRESGEAGNNES